MKIVLRLRVFFTILLCGNIFMFANVNVNVNATVYAASIIDSGNSVDRTQRIENGLLPELTTQDTKPMRLADRMQHYKIPAISIAVIENGKIVWAHAVGVADLNTGAAVNTDTLFQAASISKPVSAITALRLVEMKKLNLDEDINNKLTAWKVPDSEWSRTAKVTLRRILTHRAGLTVSGFYGYGSDEPIPSLEQILNGAKPANNAPVIVDMLPQAESRYSGGGFTVMQQLISDVSGKNFAATVDELVLQKLGMAHSTYGQPPTGVLANNLASAHAEGSVIPGKFRIHPELAAAGLWTTPTDLAAFAVELSNAAAGKSSRVVGNKRVLGKKMATQMLTPQAGDEWGLGIILQGKSAQQRFTHNGANMGFRSTLVAYKDGSHGAVLMTNSDSGMSLMQEVLRAIAVEYKWPGYMAPRRTIVEVPVAAMQKHVGYFEGKNNLNVTARMHNNQLYLRNNGPWVKLLPGSENRFYPGAEDVEINFTQNKKGETTGLSIREGSDNAKQALRAAEKPALLSAAPFFLRGSMNNWGGENRMQPTDTNNAIYTTTTALKPGKYEFKFGSADYKKIDFGVMPDAAGGKPGEEISVVPVGQNIEMTITQEGRYTFTLDASRAGDARLKIALAQ